VSDRKTALANRHIGKLLDNLDKLVEMSPLARTAVMQEMHWLAEDVEKASNHGDGTNEDRHNR